MSDPALCKKRRHWVDLDWRGKGRVTISIQGDRLEADPELRKAVQKVVNLIGRDNKK